jgi:hypothetical protein
MKLGTCSVSAAMKKGMLAIHKENESRVGKETLEEVYKQTGFKP